MGWQVILLGMVGDHDDHKISSVPNVNSLQNLRPLSWGVRDIFFVLSRVASQLKTGSVILSHEIKVLNQRQLFSFRFPLVFLVSF